MEAVKLEDIIQRYVDLSPPNHNGWCSTRCEVCNDHTNKGLRGNFLFDGDTVVYKCWNCGITTKYNPTDSEYMPKNMVKVLTSFGIPETEWKQVVLMSKAFTTGIVNTTTVDTTILNIEPSEVKLPPTFYSLKKADTNQQFTKDAIIYLDSRCIDYKKYNFMLPKYSTNKILAKWNNRIIIPIYKSSKLIYYIGRDIYNKSAVKYESPPFPKEKVLYGFDRLFDNSSDYIIITEGFIDAFCVNGVALLGKELSKYHIEWLNKSKKRKIIVPDKFGGGDKLAYKALELGWDISTPDIGSEAGDINDAIIKYGELYVMRSILSNVANGFKAEQQIMMYCK